MALVLGLALGAGGCTALPGSGPWMGGAQSGSTEALPFDVIDLTPTTVVAYRLPESPDRPTSAASNLSAAMHIAIAPGDSLKVRIFERYGGNIFPTISGMAADLGVQRVVRRTARVRYLSGIVRRVSIRSSSASSSNRQQGAEFEVQSLTARARTRTVMVSGGASEASGRWSILDDIRTVADAINMAGGPVGGSRWPCRRTSSKSSGAARGPGDPEGPVEPDPARWRRYPRPERRRDRRRSNPRVYTVLGAVIAKSGVMSR
jgi:polysaccharide export outer membrane protein